MADIRVNVGSSADTSGLQKFTHAIGETQSGLSGLSTSGKSSAESLASFALKVTAAVGGLAGLVSMSKECVRAFNEQEKADKMLARVAGENTAVFQRQASVLQQTLGVSDDMAQGLQTMALQFGAAPQQVDGLVRAVLDFSAATGKDASEAMRTLMIGVENGGAGLKKLGVHYKSTGEKGKDLDLATKAIADRMGGAAAASAGTFGGSLARLDQQMGELKEGFGKFIADVFVKSGVIDALTLALTKARAALFGDEEQDAQDSRKKELERLFKEKDALVARLKSSTADEKIYYPGDEMNERGALADQPNAAFNYDQALKQKINIEDQLDTLKRKIDEINKAKISVFAPIGAAISTESTKGGGKNKQDDKALSEYQKNLDDRLDAMTAFESMKRKQREEDEKEEEDNIRSMNTAFKAGLDERLQLQDEADKEEVARYASQNERLTEDSKRRQKALVQSMKEGAEAQKRNEASWAAAGASIGMAFAGALANTLEEAIAGGDVGVALANGLFAIAQTVASYLPPPFNAILGGAAMVGSAVVRGVSRSAKKKHGGGWVDDSGPYFHSGGWPGLAPDEVPIIAQKGERVLNRQESREYVSGGNRNHMTVNVNSIDSKGVMEFFTDQGGRGFYNAMRSGRGMMPALARGF